MRYTFLLDTNAFSDIISPRGITARERFRRASLNSVCISSITLGEFEYGMALKPDATRKARQASLLLEQVGLLSWTAETSAVYGKLRAEMHRLGKALGSLDMLIAAQALEIGATLVTSDRAFRYVPILAVEVWRA